MKYHGADEELQRTQATAVASSVLNFFPFRELQLERPSA
jgi:hypothetical protein